MALRDFGFEREIELAHAATAAPLSNEMSDGGGLCIHVRKIPDPAITIHYPPGNRHMHLPDT